MSKAKALKKRLTALEAKVLKCDDPADREKLKQNADRLRKDLEFAGYLSPTTKQTKTAKKKHRNTKKTVQNVDPLIRAQNGPGFAGGVVKIVQGGSVRGK